jgi:hypothetical protein
MSFVWYGVYSKQVTSNVNPIAETLHILLYKNDLICSKLIRKRYCNRERVCVCDGIKRKKKEIANNYV